MPPLADGLTSQTVGRTVLTVIGSAERDLVWLALSVMTGSLPSDAVVAEISRESEFDRGDCLTAALVEMTTHETVGWDVQVTTPQEVLVDVSATLPLTFTTGIQRVIRETVSRWMAVHGARPVAWTRDYAAMRDVTSGERTILETKSVPTSAPAPVPVHAVVVPWECTYITPEVLAEVARANQVRSLSELSRCRTGAIGYDCVPITSSETLIDWGGDTFAWHLSALRSFDRVAAISEAATDEFRGWCRSLASIGGSGPDISAVLLPVEVPEPDGAALHPARERFVVAGMPLVLTVGSAEPRKNQLAVLHAAEVLWREDHRFSLTFVGGRSWGAGTLARQVAALQASGRPVEIASAVTDTELFAAYRLARFTVFPSLNEGFGLPVAESLACGTPVVTSNYGSMREIAEGGGALMVDPRSSADLTDGMRRLLVDDALVARLSRDAAARPVRTWDTYAEETWRLLVR